MIFLQALALLGQDLVLAAGLGFELGVDRRGLRPRASMLGLLGRGLGLDDDLGLLGLRRALRAAARFSASIFSASASAALAIARFWASCTAASASRFFVSRELIRLGLLHRSVGLGGGDRRPGPTASPAIALALASASRTRLSRSASATCASRSNAAVCSPTFCSRSSSAMRSPAAAALP